MAEDSAVGSEIKPAGLVDIDTHNLTIFYLPMTPIYNKEINKQN